MSGDIEDRGVVRQYLLGELTDQERERFEVLMMSDTELFNEMLLVEEDLVEAYVHGTMSGSDRQRFELSYMSTADGREQVSFARALGKYVKSRAADTAHSMRPGKARRPIFSRVTWFSQLAGSPYLRGAAAAVIVIGLGLGIWRLFFYQSEVSKGLNALAYAYRDQRPVEARISGFGYAPAANMRGGEDNVDRDARKRAERIILDAEFEHPSAATYHAVGKLYLADGKFDDAIGWFGRAVAADPNNAQLQSDYGAALLEKGNDHQLKGESGKSFEEFGQSNEHLSKALALNDSLLEALFNRALCKEHLLLYRSAAEDWKNYLGRDSNSKWADEARQRLQDLEARPRQTSQVREELFLDFLGAQKRRDETRSWKLISQSRDQTGSFIEQRLLDSYLDSVTKGSDHKANEALEALVYASEVERRQAHDLFVPELVRFYESATPAQRELIVDARAQMKSGLENYRKANFDAALKTYLGAKVIFERIGDTCDANYVDYLVGICYVQNSKPESALTSFEPLARRCENASYRCLLAQTLTAMSGADQYRRDFSAAIENTNHALKVWEEMGDGNGILSGRYQLGEIYRFVENGRKALDLYAHDLAVAQSSFPGPAQRWARYFSISRAFDQLDLHAAALDFQKEALQLALESQAPRLICRSYNFLGLMFSKSGNYGEAASSIQSAIELGNSLPERRVRIEAVAYSFLQLGDVNRKAGDLKKAMENYEQAIRFYDELDSKFFGFNARKDKLLCCIEDGGCPAINNEIEAVLKLFEDQRAGILEESNRNTFFDSGQNIYDVAIDFEYFKMGDSRKAFEYSERSRGRSLGDLASTDVKLIDDPSNPDIKFGLPTQPMTVEKIREGIPQQSQILQYAVLKNSVLIWVVSRDGLASRSRSIPIEELTKRVEDFLQLLLRSSDDNLDEFTSEATYLYGLLIAPVDDLLDSSKQICIVPDKILNYLPFGALMSAPSKYFIEEHEFVLSPSASMFVRSSDWASAKESALPETLLSVGNPNINWQQFPNLPNLVSAETEARAITNYYISRGPIIGSLATKERVLSEMERSDVIHLATHAIADEWYPMRSKLLLAKDSEGIVGPDSGVLRAFEIYKLKLSRVKLVVLSACQTGVEKYYGGEGMIGLSRPFLAKRIPLVVASLWQVESKETARLMTSFHRHRKAGDGMPTVSALCEAQREMLRSSNGADRQPRNWASFVTIGGYATF